MSKRDFTLILPYYENPEQLQRQYKALAALPDEVKKHLVADRRRRRISRSQAAIVPTEFSSRHDGLASFRLFRIDVDVRWNWLAARNIGVHTRRRNGFF
jgi:hypothetical protein